MFVTEKSSVVVNEAETGNIDDALMVFEITNGGPFLRIPNISSSLVAYSSLRLTLWNLRLCKEHGHSVQWTL